VAQRVESGAIATLVPVAADEAACAEWTRGYDCFYALLDSRFRGGETVVLRGFGIRVLAGMADALEELEEFTRRRHDRRVARSVSQAPRKHGSGPARAVAPRAKDVSWCHSAKRPVLLGKWQEVQALLNKVNAARRV
jgi:hypothetical protein